LEGKVRALKVNDVNTALRAVRRSGGDSIVRLGISRNGDGGDEVAPTAFSVRAVLDHKKRLLGDAFAFPALVRNFFHMGDRPSNTSKWKIHRINHPDHHL